MKTTNNKGILLGAALLGTFTVATSVTPASAQVLRNQRSGYRKPNRGGRNYGQTFTGRVTNVRSRESFDLRVGSTTYNVYPRNRTPRGLSVGDRVQVNGVRQDRNDIRNASVTIIRNR